ncbi:hypothetical protein GLW00_12215 [Halobacillus litoralis]|uniref:Uncharacterized protein n=1 Tax=Halobacillus litoralis TaxID=45668 RepID=A0A845FBB4_9BACI|nr:hypothetical protein [Halobacillus litoralis]MYL71623.1 hypothetical protein [Halobacillus litoralis]
MIRKVSILVIVSFLMALSGLLLMVNLIDLEPGEKLGEGWYLLKAYTEQEITNGGEVYISQKKEHGEGIINLSVLFSVGMGLLYFIYKYILSKRVTGG